MIKELLNAIILGEIGPSQHKLWPLNLATNTFKLTVLLVVVLQCGSQLV